MTNNLEHNKDGFAIKYRIGDYMNYLRFNDTTAQRSISNIAIFLIGCGFGRSAVIQGLRDAADQMESDWN
jgi:hypothetical protein